MTTTLTQPNNLGYGILGALLGGGGAAIGGLSDRDAKTDIEKVGELNDGLPVYSYRYNWDDPKIRRIGLIAQEVEKIKPHAVFEMGGAKIVDYAAALKAANDTPSFGIAA
jgi:hypothetical protein